VDDFVFFCSPSSPPINETNTSFSYDLSLVQQIANALGWSWKPSKTQPFGSTFRYLGFTWDLKAKSVHIPDGKRTKYIQKLDDWMGRENHSQKEAESLLGTLVHCSLAIPEGHPRLPAISKFITSFNGKSPFSCRTPNSTSTQDVQWWQESFRTPMPRSSIKPPPPPLETDIQVDASTSFGIGLVFNQEWDSLELLPGWDTHPKHKIGWAEIVALECGVWLAIHQSIHNTHLVIKSDNMGVIGTLTGGKS
jgi:hypothetical protein